MENKFYIISMKNFDFIEKHFQISGPVELYFECISSCEMKDGVCISSCVEIIKQHND